MSVALESSESESEREFIPGDKAKMERNMLTRILLIKSLFFVLVIISKAWARNR